MSEISKETVEFWRKRGDLVEVKQKFAGWIHSDLMEFDSLVNMSFTDEYLSMKGDLTAEFLNNLCDEILDYADCLDTNLEFSDDDRYSIDLACESLCSKLQHLSTIISVEKVI
ncbi:hypothetical protein [Stutzerimonas zhaodongensis]|jgi:hypothetical protein|uniref:hypothetical protein n=1 Tax=Stutzerimonas zhaodongensis TaxID=1176257 RepID=UPI001F4D74F8|nr:hypothetical protein [Stutzerimonas zhaodongensis]UNG17540.1 hypothetical protein MKP10_17215 [Stutzerimonas zhaodongensis]